MTPTAEPNGVQETRAPEQTRVPFRYSPRVVYREQVTPDHEAQARLLEKLRYQTYSAASLRQRVMQRLGDIGRRWLPITRIFRY